MVGIHLETNPKKFFNDIILMDRVDFGPVFITGIIYF